MLRSSVFRLLVAAVAVIGGVAETCRADLIIVQTASIAGDGIAPQPTYALTDYLQSLTFNKFNVADGELQSVVITLETKAYSEGSFTNAQRVTATVSLSSTVSTTLSSSDAGIASLLGGVSTSNTLALNNVVLPARVSPGVPSVTPYSQGHQDDSDTATFTATADMNKFVGAGTFNFDASGVADVVYTGPGNTDYNNTTLAYATITLTYNYIINPPPHVVTPEPSSMVMAAIGCVGLIAVRARRRSA